MAYKLFLLKTHDGRYLQKDQSSNGYGLHQIRNCRINVMVWVYIVVCCIFLQSTILHICLSITINLILFQMLGSHQAHRRLTFKYFLKLLKEPQPCRMFDSSLHFCTYKLVLINLNKWRAQLTSICTNYINCPDIGHINPSQYTQQSGHHGAKVFYVIATCMRCCCQCTARRAVTSYRELYTWGGMVWARVRGTLMPCQLLGSQQMVKSCIKTRHQELESFTQSWLSSLLCASVLITQPVLTKPGKY